MFITNSIPIHQPYLGPADDIQALAIIFLNVSHNALPQWIPHVVTNSRNNHAKVRSILQLGRGSEELLLWKISIIVPSENSSQHNLVVSTIFHVLVK